MAGIGVQDHRNHCSGSRNPRSRSRNRCSRWIGISVQDGPEYAVSAQEPSTTVAWNELTPLVLRHTILIAFSSGIEVQGTALAVQPDGIVIDITKTGHPSYPEGEAVIPRRAISVIEVSEETRGWAKPLLSAAAGAGAALAYFPHAISDSRINVSDSRRVAEWAGIAAGAAVAGYFIGKKISTTVRVIRVSSASNTAKSGALSYNAP